MGTVKFCYWCCEKQSTPMPHGNFCSTNCEAKYKKQEAEERTWEDEEEDPYEGFGGREGYYKAIH